MSSANQPSVSLYRTWRPKTFAELVGQDAVVKTLSSAITKGRLAHAYLFSGPRGSGKTSAAKILARCINCVNGPTVEPDNTCENCVAILEGRSLDVLEIDAASNRGIDEIRELRDKVKFAPSAMRRKVYIIDEAHMLTREGANAFLKTLEEPPEHVVFILATTEPEKLPVTILSRCQRYAFRRISVPVMIERLRHIATAEGFAFTEEALGQIAYRADGGLRDALTMLEQVAAFGDGEVGEQTVAAAFGQSTREWARELVEAVCTGDATTALDAVAGASDAGAEMATLMRETIAGLRQLLVARLNPDLLDGELASEDVRWMIERAEHVPQARLVRGLKMLADAMADARRSGLPRLELEVAMLRLLLSADAAPAGEETRAAPSPRPSPRPAPPPVATEMRPHRAAVPASAAPAPAQAAPGDGGASLTVQKIKSVWEQVRGRVGERSAPVNGMLAAGEPVSMADGVLTLSFSNAIAAETVRGNARLVEEALGDVLRIPVKVVVQGTRRPAGPHSGEAPGRGGATSRAGSGGGTEGGNPSIQGGGGDGGNLLDYAVKKFST
ncbi:MAG TPA: DNA polymerase III subunit gamma/tau [Candidatus Dormibacteraeota bacterium]|nr:DNA polymerase III subunit gamma/tau [Candidatus Dormibacteraeota bacterium]